MVRNYGACRNTATHYRLLAKRNCKIVKVKRRLQKMLEDGAVLVGDTLTQFGAFIKSEQVRWAKVVEKAKITLD